MRKSIEYQEWLIEQLKDHDLAIAYLNAAIEESLQGDEESQKVFLMALKDVIEAQGGFDSLIRKAHLDEENIYKIFSEESLRQGCALDWHNLNALFTALGLHLELSKNSPVNF